MHKSHAVIGSVLPKLRPVTRLLSTTRTVRHEQENSLIPVLSELPKRFFPSWKHHLRGMFFERAIIIPAFDSDFNRRQFFLGAKQAVQVVSDALSRLDFDSIQDLVEAQCLQDLKRRLAFSTESQRQRLKVKAEDVYNEFIYEIGIMLHNDSGRKDRWVEITYVAHSLPSSVDGTEATTRTILEGINAKRGPIILNYRFLRRYTRGEDHNEYSWTVSAINHFTADDMGRN